MRISAIRIAGFRNDARAAGRDLPNAVPPMSRRNEDLWRSAGTEPRLDDLYADPIVHLLLARDGLSPAQSRAVAEAARLTLLSRLAMEHSSRLPGPPGTGQTEEGPWSSGPIL